MATDGRVEAWEVRPLPGDRRKAEIDKQNQSLREFWRKI